MKTDTETVCRLFGRCGFEAHRTRFRGSLPYLLRYREQYSRHARQIARRHGQFERLIDPSDASEDGLPNPADCLAPTKVFLNALANHLTDPVTVVPCRSTVNGTSTATRVVLRHMRRGLALPAGGDEIGAVVGFVGSDCLGMISGDTVEHPDRRFSFAGTVSVRDHGADDQPRTVLISTWPW